MVLWLSVQSLSLQVECRTALIHYLFFSDGGKAHRKLIAGPKFDQKAWGKDPLLVANGPNTTWKLILWMEGHRCKIGSGTAQFTFCPNFLDAKNYMQVRARDGQESEYHAL